MSAGVYKYPLKEAAEIAVGEVRAGLEKETTAWEAIFVLFGKAAYDVYAEVLGSAPSDSA